MAAMLASTPARIGVGRAGTRYRTNTLLRFRADHAAAKDAVRLRGRREAGGAARARRADDARARQAHLPRAARRRPRALRRGASSSLAERCASAPAGAGVLRRRPVGGRDQRAPRGVPRRAHAGAGGARLSRGHAACSCAARASRSWTRSRASSTPRRASSPAASGPASASPTRCRAYYIYRPASGATDADREVICNINPRGLRACQGRASRRRRVRAHPRRQEIGSRPVSERQRASGSERERRAWTCPVCGFAGLAEPPVDPTGSPTYSICPCCGTQFGADDLDKPHAELRKDVGAGRRGVVVAERARARRLGRQRAARRRQDSPMAVRGTDARAAAGELAAGSGWSTCRRSSRACWRCGPSRASTSSSPPSGSCPTGCAPSGMLTCIVGRRALRRARRGHQGGAGRGGLRALVLRRRRASVGAAVGRGDRRLRGARSRRDARGARRLRAHARARGLVLRRRRAAASSRSSRTWCARPGRYLSRAGRHRRRCADGVPDRAAARVDGRRSTPRSRRRRCAWPSGSARRRRPTSAAAISSAICPTCEAAARAFAAAVVDVARAPTDATRAARARRRGAGRAAARRQGRGHVSRAGDRRAADATSPST